MRTFLQGACVTSFGILCRLITDKTQADYLVLRSVWGSVYHFRFGALNRRSVYCHDVEWYSNQSHLSIGKLSLKLIFTLFLFHYSEMHAWEWWSTLHWLFKRCRSRILYKWHEHAIESSNILSVVIRFRTRRESKLVGSIDLSIRSCDTYAALSESLAPVLPHLPKTSTISFKVSTLLPPWKLYLSILVRKYETSDPFWC